MTTETTTPTTTHLSVDLCPHHGHAMFAVVTTDGNGYGAGVRLLGPKSCCVLRREVARWPVTADDLRRLASDLTPAPLAPPPTETTTPQDDGGVTDGTLVDWPCKKCKHPQTVERKDDTEYDDHHYRCPACNYAWWEEGADA